MDPRIVNEDLAGKRSEQRQQCSAEIAKADQREWLSLQEKRIVIVALELLTHPNGRVSLVHPSREGNGHAQHHFRNGSRVDRRGREHRNPPAVAFGVVDVREEIAFDIEDRAQARSAIEAGFVEGRLPDQRNRIRQMVIDMPGRRGRAIVPEYAAEFLEPTLGWRIENAFDPARERIEQDDALGGK